MKTGKFNLGKALKTILFSLLFVTAAYSQEPPKPVESAYFDKWVGEWTGEGDFGGRKQNQMITCKWDLNHQFLSVEVKAKDSETLQEVYSGKGFYTIDKEGNVAGYWFDIFGTEGISLSKGKITGDKMVNSVTAPGYTGTESGEFKSNDEVVLSTNGTYENNGEKMPVQSNRTYKRKK